MTGNETKRLAGGQRNTVARRANRTGKLDQLIALHKARFEKFRAIQSRFVAASAG